MERLRFWFEILSIAFYGLSEVFRSGKELMDSYNSFSKNKNKKAKKKK
ncbi:MAG TPA: hypothetical protein PKY82_02075 [Pyrinomonadaceae bacterium]|nr:hypothetical protein [Pyrinomonadaceae bacterium]